MIKKDDVVRFKPEWQDEGDALIEWRAVEDEDGGRVLIAATLPGVSYLPTYRVQTCMVEKTS